MNIVLAGSMMFMEQMEVVKQQLEQYGAGVTFPSEGQKSGQIAVRAYNKQALQRLQNADALLVVNEEKRGIRGYIGSNTLIEIGMAFALGKPVYLLNDYDRGQGCADELDALVNGVVGENIGTWLKEVTE